MWMGNVNLTAEIFYLPPMGLKLNSCLERLSSAAVMDFIRVILSPACSSVDMYKDYEERGEDFRRLVGSI